jgi:hypothetical protein
MEWEIDKNILRRLVKGQTLRLLATILNDHKGKDFKDVDDLMNQLYPKPPVKLLGSNKK